MGKNPRIQNSDNDLWFSPVVSGIIGNTYMM
jgi:hypothetical protein